MLDTRTPQDRERDWLRARLADAPALTDARRRRIVLLLNPAPAPRELTMNGAHGHRE